MEKETRKGRNQLRVPVLQAEEALIKANAGLTGLSVAAFLRQLGMGYEVRGVLDSRAVLELSQINSDLGRLAGLLKLWLADDERLRIDDPAELQHTILGVLAQIKENQAVLLACAKKVTGF
jgi:hypothetical protein